MDMGKTVFGVVGLAVGIMLVAMLAIPVIEDVSFDRVYSDNDLEGVNRFDTGNTVMSHVAGGALTYTVDGVTVTSNAQQPVFVSPYVFILVGNSSADMRVADSYALLNLGDTNWTLTVSGNTLTVVGEGDDTVDPIDRTWTVNANRCLHLDTDGDYAVAKAGTNFNEGRYAYACAASSGLYFIANGFVENSAIPGEAVIYPSGTDSVSVALTSTPAGDYNTFASASISYNSQSYAATVVLPVDYYVNVEGAGSNSLLLSIIPVMLIIGIVMMAVRLIGGRE